MARKKRTIIDEDIPEGTIVNNDTGDKLEDLLLPDMEDVTLQGLMTRLKGFSDYQINIYNVTARGSEFRFTVDDPDILTEAYIQDVCGAGKYAVRVLKNNIPLKSYYITIGSKPALPGSIPAQSNPQVDINGMQAQMYRDQAAFMQQMVLALINKETPRSDTSLSDILTGVQTLHGIGGGKDPMDLFIKALEIGKSMSGNNGPTDWKTELISTAKDILAPVAGEIARAALKNPPATDPKALPSAGGFVEEVHNMVPDVVLKQGIKFLKGKIMSGMDVGLATDWILANVDDPTFKPFIELAIRGEFQDFVKLDNELANEPYNSWIREAIKNIKEAYVEIQATTDTGRTDGNVSDIASHEKVS
jgi:hypothetical protein